MQEREQELQVQSWAEPTAQSGDKHRSHIR